MKRDFFLIIFLVFLSLLISYFTPLSFDELYYWYYARDFAFGYFDHPPMVAWLIGISTFIFQSDHAFVVRLPFHLLGMASIWYFIRHFFTNSSSSSNQSDQLRAYLMAFALPLVSFFSYFALPDLPLVVFSILLWVEIDKILKNHEQADDRFLPYIRSSLWIAGMFYSKYYGLLILIFSITSAIKILYKKKGFYLTVFLTIILFSPHLIWQYHHDFVSFKFHLFSRVEKHFDLINLIESIAGMIFLGMVIPFLQIQKMKLWKTQQFIFHNFYWFVLFIFFISFRNRVELNWLTTAYIAMIYILFRNPSFFRSKLATICMSLFIILNFSFRFIFTMYDHKYVQEIIPRVLEFRPWHSKDFEILKEKDLPIVAQTYQVGAKLYYTLKRNVPVLHYRTRKSQFIFDEYSKNFNYDQQVYFLSTFQVNDSSVVFKKLPFQNLYATKVNLKELLEEKNIFVKDVLNYE